MSQVERVPMTQEGHDNIRKELNNLKSVERPRVVDELEAARAHGDLKENAEYHAAKEKLGYIKGRIMDLEDRLSRAEVIDPKKIQANGRVVFGAWVTLLDVESDEEVTYQIVGEYESDVSKGRISITAPIARGLVGKEVGQEVTIKTPKGSKEFELLKVEYK